MAESRKRIVDLPNATVIYGGKSEGKSTLINLYACKQLIAVKN